MSLAAEQAEALDALARLSEMLEAWTQLSRDQEEAVGAGDIEALSRLVAQRAELMTPLGELFTDVARLQDRPGESGWSRAIDERMAEVYTLGAAAASADERTVKLVEQRLHELSNEMRVVQSGRMRHLAYSLPPTPGARFLDSNS